MFNTAYRMVNDRYIAEDVMQEAFLSAFTKLDSFKGEVTFGAWLKRIVINRALTELKKFKKLHTFPVEKVDYEQREEQEPNYSTIQPKEIAQGISALKPNYRVALNLHLIEGYDYEEIAQIMDITYENSRVTISRAKNKLRSILQHEG
jgi:RNA polymerase sigma-70 factor (ECF subfamily)